MDDGQLLRKYVQDASPEAFEELVRRHVPMVYATASRVIRDPHLAEDVTQAVFLILAQKAKTLKPEVVLGGWLFTVARYASIRALAKEHRRRRHEREAARMKPMPQTQQPEADWGQIEPRLNDALAKLRQKDRDALVLRYLEDRSFAEVAAALKVSEAAAQKRVGRGLEKLRRLLGAEAGMPSVAALATVLQMKAMVPVPAGLAGSVTAAVVGGAAGATSKAFLIAKGAMKMMMWAKIKFAAAVGTVLLLGSTVGVVTISRTAAADRPTSSIQPATRPDLAQTVVTEKEQVSKRIEQFQSIVVTFQSNTTFQDAAMERMKALQKAVQNNKGRAGAGKFVAGGLRNHRFYFLNGRARYEEHAVGDGPPMNDPLFQPAPHLNVFCYDGQRISGFMQNKKATQPDALIQGILTAELPDYTIIDHALMLRPLFSSTWLWPQDIQKLDLQVKGPNELQLTITNTLAGKGINVWTLDPELGYAVREYRLFIDPGRQLHTLIECDQFRNVGGVLLPFRVTQRGYQQLGGKSIEGSTRVIEVKEYKLEDSTNTPDLYAIEWPDDRRILDARADKEFLIRNQVTALDEDASVDMPATEPAAAPATTPATDTGSP